MAGVLRVIHKSLSRKSHAAWLSSAVSSRKVGISPLFMDKSLARPVVTGPPARERLVAPYGPTGYTGLLTLRTAQMLVLSLRSFWCFGV